MKILELEIYTSHLEQQIKFYADVLELEVVKKTATSATIKIGQSLLKLVFKKESTPYHFAINIPANKAEAALAWLKERVAIITAEQTEIQYFDFWNAYAIYFYDKDNNIVELIARQRLNNASSMDFDSSSFLAISEIGFPTTSIPTAYELLNSTAQLPKYSGNLERFCAIGDENGLFIVINNNKKEFWFPTQDRAVSSDFKIKFDQNNQAYVFDYKDDHLIYRG